MSGQMGLVVRRERTTGDITNCGVDARCPMPDVCGEDVCPLVQRLRNHELGNK